MIIRSKGLVAKGYSIRQSRSLLNSKKKKVKQLLAVAVENLELIIIEFMRKEKKD